MPQALPHPGSHSLKWQYWISCISCLLMLGGMVFSRLLLSLGMILLFLNAMYPGTVKAYWQKFKTSGFAWASISFFAAYLISGLWSEDKSNWLAVVQIKLPFLFFPFAMFSLPLQDMRWLKIMVAGLLVFLLGGMGYGLYFLILYPETYATSAHLPSPMEGDYIRFTIVIVLGLMFVFFFVKHRKRLQLTKAAIVLLAFWSAVAVAYIHIQAAKSGLICFYAFLLLFDLDYGIRTKKYKAMTGYFILIICGAFLSANLPSVSRQVALSSNEGKVLQTAGDTTVANQTGSFISRLNSYKIAGAIIKEHPVAGVGAGDTKNEMDKLYRQQFPALPEVAYILPHNEFISSALAIGILLSACTLMPMVFIPLFKRRNRKNIYLLTTWVILFFGLMIEPMLEVQFGIFVFLFFINLWTDIPVDAPMSVHNV